MNFYSDSIANCGAAVELRVNLKGKRKFKNCNESIQSLADYALLLAIERMLCYEMTNVVIMLFSAKHEASASM